MNAELEVELNESWRERVRTSWAAGDGLDRLNEIRSQWERHAIYALEMSGAGSVLVMEVEKWMQQWWKE